MGTITYSKIKKMSPQLLVADIDRSIEFYTNKLGFDIDFRYEDFYSGISKDGFSIHLKSVIRHLRTDRTEEKMKTSTLYFQQTVLKIYMKKFQVNRLTSSNRCGKWIMAKNFMSQTQTVTLLLFQKKLNHYKIYCCQHAVSCYAGRKEKK